MHLKTSTKVTIASLLVLFWAGATVYAFWWFEFKNLRPFDTRANGQIVNSNLDTMESSLLKLTAGSNSDIRVVHFWNPDCYCNRFNQQHLQQIRQQYESQGIKFYLALVNNSESYTSQIKENFSDMPILEVGMLAEQIPSTPSTAVIKSGHGLTYFGPYSEGAMCSAQSGSFVEKVLDATLNGNPAAQLNRLAFGCYCDLQPT